MINDNKQLHIVYFIEDTLSEYSKIHKRIPKSNIIYKQGINVGQKYPFKRC